MLEYNSIIITHILKNYHDFDNVVQPELVISRVDVDRAICSSLSLTEQLVIRGVYILGLTEKELAKHLNISYQQVYKVKNKSIIKILKFLSKESENNA